MKRWTKARVNGSTVDLPGLVKRRKAEADLWDTPLATSQSLGGRMGYSLSENKFDAVARDVFGYTDYQDFLTNELTSTSFLGQSVTKVAKPMVDMLAAAEAILQSRGVTSIAPITDSFRKSRGMHGLGLAIDLDVLANPYILNEAGEAKLDAELLPVYNRIADTMLGLAASAIGSLKKGRSAFGGSIAQVYDALSAESDAMKRYFGMMKDQAKVAAFLSSEWQASHPGQTAPDPAALMSQMQADYLTLGGPDDAGKKKDVAAGGGDRPFAPSSSTSHAGDPLGGFLNIDRAAVLGLTDGGFAWGAIDLGGASGDVQHFDCRLSGKGKQAFAALHR